MSDFFLNLTLVTLLLTVVHVSSPGECWLSFLCFFGWGHPSLRQTAILTHWLMALAPRWVLFSGFEAQFHTEDAVWNHYSSLLHAAVLRNLVLWIPVQHTSTDQERSQVFTQNRWIPSVLASSPCSSLHTVHPRGFLPVVVSTKPKFSLVLVLVWCRAEWFNRSPRLHVSMTKA